MTVAALLGLHALLAAAAPLAARRYGRRVFLLCATAPAATLAWVVARAPDVVAGRAIEESLPWAPELGVVLRFRVDGFSLLMLGLISGIGVLVLVYSASYFTPTSRLGRAAAALTAFAGAMAGLVVVDNLLVLYVFWELTSIASYVLIGYSDDEETSREAAQHALIVTTVGGLAMLAGFVLLGQAAGTYTLSEMVANPPGGGAVPAALGLVLLGAFTKSAQWPFHGWLPGAMVAPTPISAYLHSATMVKAGVYLVARFGPGFASGHPGWRAAVVAVGLFTLVHGAVRALRQHDLKLILAFGTVSQLGLMVALLGAGEPALTFAGVAVLLAHALYKAALFMVAGIIDQEAGTRDIRRLQAVARTMPVTAAVGIAAGVSMLGLPPLFGFIAKEAALESFLHVDLGAVASVAAAAAVVVGAALTVAYGARFLAGGFTGRYASPAVEAAVATPAHEAGAAFITPSALLAALGVGLGLAPMLATGVVEPAAVAIGAEAGEKLSLWHGVTPTLVLSLGAIVAGAGLYLARDPVERLGRRLPALPDPARVFRASVAATTRIAVRTTGIVQHGSLPVYVAVIAATAVLLPTAGFLASPTVAIAADLAPANALQLGAAALTIAAAVATAAARRRFLAVIFVGAAGYGMAVIFVLHGAPDLALTQLAVETLAVLIFVLVLRHLPERFRRPRWRFGRAGRVAVSLGVGTFVTAAAIITSGFEHAPAISHEYLGRALPEAHGHNVVNVILVDFRSLDTVGEITVLTVTAFGVASMIAAGLAARPRRGLKALVGETRASLILSVGVAAVFPLALLFATYLLFAGHNAPGGGFVAGLVAGAAFVLRYVSGGPESVRQAVPVPPPLLLGVGVALALTTGVAGWLWGETFLQSHLWHFDLILLGSVDVASALFFDVGVFLVVVGFVLMVLRTLGEEPARSRSTGATAEEEAPA